MEQRGIVSGQWAFGIFTAICVAATSFILEGDAVRTLRDQSIEANLLAERYDVDWIGFCRKSIPVYNDQYVARENLVEELESDFPKKVDTSALRVSGVLVCPSPDPNGTLGDALAMDRSTAGVYEVLPDSSLILWLRALNSAQAQQPSTAAADISDLSYLDAEQLARALAEGAALDRVLVVYNYKNDGLSDGFTEDDPDAGAAQQGPYKSSQNFSIQIQYHDFQNEAASAQYSHSDATWALIKLSNTNHIFAYYPPGGLTILDSYYRVRAYDDPHYSRLEGLGDGDSFEFPALSEREYELRLKTVSDVALQLKRELDERKNELSALGVVFSLLQFSLISAVSLIILLIVLARSISLNAAEALPPVIKDMPRYLTGTIVFLIVVAWPSALLLLFSYQFRFAYPDLKTPLELASGVWSVLAGLTLHFSVLSARRRTETVQKCFG